MGAIHRTTRTEEMDRARARGQAIKAERLEIEKCEAALALLRWMQKYLDEEGETRTFPCFTRAKLRIVETSVKAGKLRPWSKD